MACGGSISWDGLGPVRVASSASGRLWLGRVSGLPGSLLRAVAAHELGDVGSVDAKTGAVTLGAGRALAARTSRAGAAALDVPLAMHLAQGRMGAA
jgi:hypothetical protein